MKFFSVLGPVIWMMFYLCAGSVSHAGESYDYEVLEQKQYALRASGPLRADLYIPDEKDLSPAVVLIHGGGWEGGEPSDMNRFARELASNGFVVMNISYRLAPSSVHPAQVEDCRDAVRWLRQNAQKYNVDADRIAAFGYSAGAHLAMMLGVNPQDEDSYVSSRVQAVVAGAGPTDLRKYPNSPLVQGYLGGPPEGREDKYADASPIVHVSSDDAPAYIYHGKRDRLVGVEQAQAMARAYESAGVDHVLDVQPFGHVLTFFVDGDVMQRAIEFLHSRLSGRS